MKDIRMFIQDSILYLYDRSNSRVGLSTVVVCVGRQDDNMYFVKSKEIDIGKIKTSKLEKILVKELSTESVKYLNKEKISSYIKGLLDVEDLSLDLALSVISPDVYETKVQKILKEVLTLSYKERSDLLLAIADML